MKMYTKRDNVALECGERVLKWIMKYTILRKWIQDVVLKDL